MSGKAETDSYQATVRSGLAGWLDHGGMVGGSCPANSMARSMTAAAPFTSKSLDEACKIQRKVDVAVLDSLGVVMTCEPHI